MAILDYRAQLADAKSMVGAMGATITDFTVDLGAANANVGRGEPIYIHAKVGGTAVTSAKPLTCTLALILQHSHSSTAASFVTLMNLNLDGAASMTVTKLTANKLIYSGILPVTCRRYLRLKATVGITPTTAGTLDSWLDIGPLPRRME